MFFKKSNKCENCNSKINNKFSFCPYCGSNLTNEEKNIKEYGLLGKDDRINTEVIANNQPFGFGITEKMIGSLMNHLLKNLDKQFKNIDEDNFNKTEIKSLPNGIKIRIGPIMPLQDEGKKAKSSIFKRPISNEQLERLSSMPRAKAKARMKRIGDKIIYEIDAIGVLSPKDIFISKLESGYEIKAIGSKKVYANTLPINLPISAISLNDNKLLVEFKTN